MLLTEANGVSENLAKTMDPKSHPALQGYQQNAPNVIAGYLHCIFSICLTYNNIFWFQFSDRILVYPPL